MCKRCGKQQVNPGFSWCQSCYTSTPIHLGGNAVAVLQSVSPTKKAGIIKQFHVTWTKGTCPNVIEVLAVMNLTIFKRYEQYKKVIASRNAGDPNERRRWHGTRLECNLYQTRMFCQSSSCAVCGIVRYKKRENDGDWL